MTVLVILALLAAAYRPLFKARPFKTCPSRNGYGSKTSVLGDAATRGIRR